MTKQQRIGILTGGGDVPGLNAVIKSVTFRATEMGHEVVGLRRGWQGLTHVRPGSPREHDYAIPLDRTVTRAIDRTGGTMLHTSRTNPTRMRRDALPPWLTGARRKELASGPDTWDLTPVVLEHIAGLGLDCLVAIGGDDTLSYAARLHTEGVPLLAIPKTMDNDVPGTEYCIGFSTAVTRGKELINRQRTTLGSHERIGVFRIFGRDAGFTALYTAFVTSARCLIPEAPFDLERLCALLVEDRRANPSGYAFVVAAEGASWIGGAPEELGPADAFGHRHKSNVAEVLAAEIRGRTGVEAVASELTYDLRSGEPDSLDQLVAMTFANTAMDLLADGVTGRMMAVREGRYGVAPLPGPDERPRRVDVTVQYNAERLRPRYDGLLGRPLLLGMPLA
jgi:ATP-dependent phosphofructokinase / diphosphate-dependent phosphofructokinase